MYQQELGEYSWAKFLEEHGTQGWVRESLLFLEGCLEIQNFIPWQGLLRDKV